MDGCHLSYVSLKHLVAHRAVVGVVLLAQIITVGAAQIAGRADGLHLYGVAPIVIRVRHKRPVHLRRTLFHLHHPFRFPHR